MIELLIIIICILLNSLLAGSEAAFISVNKTALKQMVKQGHPQADLVLKLRENPEKTLSIIQIGITFIGAVAAAVGGAGAEESLAPLLSSYLGLSSVWSEVLAIFMVVIPITFASVVIGELVPKTIALKHSMYYALLTGPWLDRIGRYINPIARVLEGSTKWIIRRFALKQEAEEPQTDQTLELNSLSSQNQQYVYNIVGVEQMSVLNILVPWREVVFLHTNQTLDQVENIIISSGHTRLPVLQNQEVVGILNSKEFLALLKTTEKNWKSLIRPAIILQETDSLLPTLRKMQNQQRHMAIVYQDHEILGIITLEGILEAIVGDIYDENDEGMIKKILSQRSTSKKS